MNLVAALSSARVLVIVRGSDPQAALATVLVLAEEGFDLIEISLTTPDAAVVIGDARRQLGSTAHVGAGTVLSAADVDHVADAGAQFVVTPALAPSLDEASSRGLPVLAGALTPSEIVAAKERHAAAVKLFPASLGGPDYLRALRDPFPAEAFVPVGGVDASQARRYLDNGAVAVGVGSPLVGDAASGGSLEELRRRARSLRTQLESTTQ